MDLNASAAHSERAFLEERIGSVRQELDRSLKDLSEFSSKNMAVDMEQQGRITLKAADVLHANIIAARLDLSGVEQIYASNNVRVVRLQAELAELQRRLANMRGTFNISGAGDLGRLIRHSVNCPF